MNNTNSSPIICGTDFSHDAHGAAEVALGLANRLHAPIRMVHASANAASPNTKELMHTAVLKLGPAGDQFESEIIAGDADEALAQTAQTKKARLLVISAGGRRLLERWLIGSVAERTAELSSVPTLVVRNPAPFMAWIRGERPLKVIVGIDFSMTADAALRWVAAMREIGQIDVVAAYVDWPPEEAARLGISGPIGLQSNRPEIQSVLERELREKVSQVLGESEVAIRVQGNWGRADMALIDMAISAQADLVVVGTHQWHGFDRVKHTSFSRGILRHAPMSVACIPTSEVERLSGPRVRACRRVLAAVDLDGAHGFAAPYGYSIVEPGGVVRLVYNDESLGPTGFAVGGMYWEASDPKENAEKIAQAEEKLRALAPAPSEARGVTTEVEVTKSRNTAEAICAAAERFGADVICIGAHTRPGFMAKMLGTVSMTILQRSRRPVLIIWPPAQ